MLVPHAECGRGRIGEPDLYERLFSMFARREVSTDDEDRTDADLAEDTETELKRLSVVAFAPNQLSRSDKPIVAPESSASPGGPGPARRVPDSPLPPAVSPPRHSCTSVAPHHPGVQRQHSMRLAHRRRLLVLGADGHYPGILVASCGGRAAAAHPWAVRDIPVPAVLLAEDRHPRPCHPGALGSARSAGLPDGSTSLAAHSCLGG